MNGGLIDFQDNGLQRGVQEYAAQNQQQQYMAAMQGQGMMMMGQPSPTPSMLMAGAYQQPPQQALAGQPVFQPVAPSGQALASQPVFQAVTPSGQAYISGPPSFLHMNGVTYKPVEDHPMMQSDPRAGNGVKAPASEPAPAAEPGIRTLSEDEFHQAIREHVESKVDSYMSKQEKLHQHQPRGAAGQPAKSHRVASSSKRGGGHIDEEQAAAMRVQAVNASMRGQTKPAAWQACVNKW